MLLAFALALLLALIALTFAVLLLAVAGLLLAIAFGLHAVTLALLRLLLLLALLLAAHLVLIAAILGLLAIPFAALLVPVALLLSAVALHLALPLFAIAHVLGAITFQLALALPLTTLTLAPGPVIAVLTLVHRVGGIGRISGLRAVDGGGAIAATVAAAIAGVVLAGNRAGSAQHGQSPHAGPARGGGHQCLQGWFHGVSGEVWVGAMPCALNVRQLFRVDFATLYAHQMRASFALWTSVKGGFFLIFQTDAIVTLLSKAQPKRR